MNSFVWLLICLLALYQVASLTLQWLYNSEKILGAQAEYNVLFASTTLVLVTWILQAVRNAVRLYYQFPLTPYKTDAESLATMQRDSEIEVRVQQCDSVALLVLMLLYFSLRIALNVTENYFFKMLWLWTISCLPVAAALYWTFTHETKKRMLSGGGKLKKTE